ncbi:GMC family oxidoreductase [Thalassotalea fonticola]|uniref:GMC family oxidoreductase n=1 Tax=Thalassotalea fonticola TaxID=3065649 RepID=A0ABZ0GU76_9GAMM|nr:GMC family oxidoreductase [Colwelliaceae bacterium S1-1]
MIKTKNYDFDAIVVGSGMSGGYAAKEFCEKGYKTLVLDRGKPIEHGNYETEFKPPWEMEFRGKMHSEEIKEKYFIQKKGHGVSDYTKHHFINDLENPYIQGKPYLWTRSSKVGGKSVIWSRQSYRWNKLDFEANQKDGHGIDWPIRYDDLAPWYDYVEPFIGISGSYENLDELPDGQFLPPIPLNVVERQVKASIETNFPGRKMIPARVAHLTEPQPIHLELGRGQCQSRNQCGRGCSWGGYYSSVSGALPAAKRTGNLTLTANAQVQEVLYDSKTGKASGIRYVDTVSGETNIVTARVVFMCASTLGTLQILMNSTSDKYPDGIGNTSGVLGRYIMDHVHGAGANGIMPGHRDSYYKGRNPGGIYIPRFQNIKEQQSDYLRGYGYQGGASRSTRVNAQRANQTGIGKSFKEANREPGSWKFKVTSFGEVLPDFNNRVFLHASNKDQWGMPLLITNVAYGENEAKMKQDMMDSAVAMLKAAGLKNVRGYNKPMAPGRSIHEMGGACMGRDPKTSYLNQWNQSHEVANLFVTDGAAFSSVSCVNPSITFMALTARAVDYADKQLKSGII